MSVSAEYTSVSPLRRHAEVELDMLTWSEAFLAVERLVAQGMHSASILFSRGHIEIADSCGGHTRRFGLRQQHNFSPLGRLLRLSSSTGFTATTFVPGLLTFLDRPCRIALVADSKADREALEAELASHAPWHAFSTLAPEDAAGGDFDIVLSAAECSRRPFSGDHAARHRQGLVIVAPSLFPRHGYSILPALRQIVAKGAQPVR